MSVDIRTSSVFLLAGSVKGPKGDDGSVVSGDDGESTGCWFLLCVVYISFELFRFFSSSNNVSKDLSVPDEYCSASCLESFLSDLAFLHE